MPTGSLTPHYLSLLPSNPLAIFHLAFSSLVNEQQKCARNVRQDLDRDSAGCVGCDCCCDNSLWLTKYLSTHQARQRGTAVIAIAIATYFSLVFYVAHAIFCFCVWMILKSSLGPFLVFSSVVFCAFLRFVCLLSLSSLFIFIFASFFLLLLAHFLISHGSLVKLVKTATEDLIKSGISLINISASGPSACLHRRVEVQVTSGRMLSFG